MSACLICAMCPCRPIFVIVMCKQIHSKCGTLHSRRHASIGQALCTWLLFAASAHVLLDGYNAILCARCAWATHKGAACNAQLCSCYNAVHGMLTCSSPHRPTLPPSGAFGEVLCHCGFIIAGTLLPRGVVSALVAVSPFRFWTTQLVGSHVARLCR